RTADGGRRRPGAQVVGVRGRPRGRGGVPLALHAPVGAGAARAARDGGRAVRGGRPAAGDARRNAARVPRARRRDAAHGRPAAPYRGRGDHRGGPDRRGGRGSVRRERAARRVVERGVDGDGGDLQRRGPAARRARLHGHGTRRAGEGDGGHGGRGGAGGQARRGNPRRGRAAPRRRGRRRRRAAGGAGGGPNQLQADRPAHRALHLDRRLRRSHQAHLAEDEPAPVDRGDRGRARRRARPRLRGRGRGGPPAGRRIRARGRRGDAHHRPDPRADGGHHGYHGRRPGEGPGHRVRGGGGGARPGRDRGGGGAGGARGRTGPHGGAVEPRNDRPAAAAG